MKEAYIIDGDIVIIEQTEVAENSGNVVFKNQRQRGNTQDAETL